MIIPSTTSVPFNYSSSLGLKVRSAPRPHGCGLVIFAGCGLELIIKCLTLLREVICLNAGCNAVFGDLNLLQPRPLSFCSCYWRVRTPFYEGFSRLILE